MTLDEARQNIGADVTFRGGASAEDENGVITSVNERYVFVRYAGDQAAKATRPGDLVLLGGEPLRLAIDEDCPECGWPERFYEPGRDVFGCTRRDKPCGYESKERTR